MVHHRQQLDVREAEILHVRRQLLRELAPAEALPPRRRMHLVDRERAVERLPPATSFHPVVVVPLVLRERDDGRRLRRQLRLERERIGLLDRRAIDMELVALPDGRPFHDPFPDARLRDGLERVARPPPSR